MWKYLVIFAPSVLKNSISENIFPGKQGIIHAPANGIQIRIVQDILTEQGGQSSTDPLILRDAAEKHSGIVIRKEVAEIRTAAPEMIFRGKVVSCGKDSPQRGNFSLNL